MNLTFNGGGGVLICMATITNTFAGSPAVAPKPATVYQRIGSAITGTGAPGTCTPVNVPGITSVTAATVGHCNGSGNGGGALTKCQATVNNVVTAAAAPTATPVVAPTATPAPVALPAAAPTATPAAPVTTLPSTSTVDRSGPSALAGLLLALIGALIVRSRRTVRTDR